MVDAVEAPNATKAPNSEDLTIDELLERYLVLLDQYQSFRRGLSQNLSSGYLALARANFSNPNRVRYGQDFYDDRMQASTLCLIEDGNPSFRLKSSTTDTSQGGAESQEQNSSQSMTENVTCSNGESKDAEKQSSSSSDPLRWFGILLPPALRESQNSFSNVITGDIPSLASIVKEMKELEIRVRRARKKLKKAGCGVPPSGIPSEA